MSSLLKISIILILISLTNAVPLDGNCTANSQCDRPGELICPQGRCQCDAPWYYPCNTGCEIQHRFAYEGERCRRHENCLDNAQCSNTTGLCTCNEGFSPFNGACYKKNNETCTTGSDCWSGQCDSSIRRCTCKPGYQQSNDGRCQQQLLPLYENLSKANETNGFCYDDTSCSNLLAVCANDSIHPQKFCQCPSSDYTLNTNTKQCETVVNDRLSPYNEAPSAENRSCVYCKDEHAVCVSINNRKTCWCRAGYDKVDDTCQRVAKKLIFPTLLDSSLHSYTSNCRNDTTTGNSTERGLCTCAPFYEYVAGDGHCRKIERQWISENFEYGLCTRITSNDMIQSSNRTLLCPSPLQCLVNGDRYVCSCGLDKFLEQRSSGSICVYRLRKNATDVLTECPVGAERSNNTCQCKSGYKQVDVDRRCELILRPDSNSNTCDGNRLHPATVFCTDLYGGAAEFCGEGECRCQRNISFTIGNNSRCYGLLNLNITYVNTYCPPNSIYTRSRCECAIEYRPSDDFKSCVPKSRLFDSTEIITHQSDDLTEQFCNVLYPGGSVVFNSTSPVKACQCDITAFRSPDAKQCWPLLYTDLPKGLPLCLIPNSIHNGSNPNQCICTPGFRPDSTKKACNRITTPLDTVISSANDIHPLTDTDCIELFGRVSKANDSRCVCSENIAFQSAQRSFCYALLNTPTGISTLRNSSCPADASIRQTALGMCQCNPGFITSDSSRSCTTAVIPLIGTKALASPPSICTNYTNDNCIAKYGDGSFCEGNQCWCNRNIAFKTSDNLCERFSNYIFPSTYERNNVSCDVNKDCYPDVTDINSVECKRINVYDDYKVCVCKAGWYLNPKSQNCETRCPSNCNEIPNSVCDGYNCQCKYGFNKVNDTCIQNPNELELYKQCNSSFTDNKNNSYQCSSCNRGACAYGYKDAGFRCEKYNFDSVRCISQPEIFCNNLIDHSQCYPNDNKCVCSGGYYRDGNKCARPVDQKCADNEECGSNTICVSQRCRCDSGFRTVDTQDAFGRIVQRCTNGVDQIRFSPVLLLLFVLARAFFV